MGNAEKINHKLLKGVPLKEASSTHVAKSHTLRVTSSLQVTIFWSVLENLMSRTA